ncbi:MAG: DUF554 domain-containing protein [Alloprevotella sp.]|nr:DUF554 domain-containing protein [Bacteroidales bacterium]MDY3944053.1 DUF554 domain-containing protein [Alloprevotella sp.]
MYAILLNFIGIVVGAGIGALARPKIREKYITVLNTAMGLASLVLGVNVAMTNIEKAGASVLFIFCLAIGGVIGTLLRLDERMERTTARFSKGKLSEGILTGILLCCIGTLSMVGPILSALYNDDSYLITSATLNFVTMIVLASTYGFGVAVSAVVVFLWQSAFYWSAKLSQVSLQPELLAEISIVGGVLIAAAGLGILHIKDCKTINLLPALCIPPIYFAIRHFVGF